MSQVTWRASDDLVERVKEAALREGQSVNEFLTRLARAVVDPAFADDGMERTRERLARAGILASPRGPRRRPAAALVRDARAAAGHGEPLSDFVSRDRG